MWWYTHNDFISPCTKQTIRSDTDLSKTQIYDVKHFQAHKLKSKHFSDLEKATLKFKHFQGFQAPQYEPCKQDTESLTALTWTWMFQQ